jgi:hypothetical protein
LLAAIPLNCVEDCIVNLRKVGYLEASVIGIAVARENKSFAPLINLIIE